MANNSNNINSDLIKNKNSNQDEADSNSDNQDSQENSSDSSDDQEIGGRKGPEPVRYGDWEKDGRCIDF